MSHTVLCRSRVVRTASGAMGDAISGFYELFIHTATHSFKCTGFPIESTAWPLGPPPSCTAVPRDRSSRHAWHSFTARSKCCRAPAQQSPQKLLRSNRRLIGSGTECFQLQRRGRQGRNHRPPDGSQRVGSRAPPSQRERAEQPGLLGIVTAHREPPGGKDR